MIAVLGDFHFQDTACWSAFSEPMRLEVYERVVDLDVLRPQGEVLNSRGAPATRPGTSTPGLGVRPWSRERLTSIASIR